MKFPELGYAAVFPVYEDDSPCLACAKRDECWQNKESCADFLTYQITGVTIVFSRLPFRSIHDWLVSDKKANQNSEMLEGVAREIAAKFPELPLEVKEELLSEVVDQSIRHNDFASKKRMAARFLYVLRAECLRIARRLRV